MRFKASFVVALLPLFVLSGCSVVMSANKSGTSISKISRCRTRDCLLTKPDVTSLSYRVNSKGRLLNENFRVQKPKGSALRAGAHGVLDVATLGLWEVVGTPVEAVADQKKYYIIHVTYESDGQHIASIKLQQ